MYNYIGRGIKLGVSIKLVLNPVELTILHNLDGTEDNPLIRDDAMSDYRAQVLPIRWCALIRMVLAECALNRISEPAASWIIL